MNVYIASSWRNRLYETLREQIKQLGHEVLDWQRGEQPLPSWTAASEEFADAVKHGYWPAKLAKKALEHPRAKEAHKLSADLLQKADALLLLTPCGRSAHYEAGIAEARGLPRAIYLSDGVEPEVMACEMPILLHPSELQEWLSSVSERREHELQRTKDAEHTRRAELTSKGAMLDAIRNQIVTSGFSSTVTADLLDELIDAAVALSDAQSKEAIDAMVDQFVQGERAAMSEEIDRMRFAELDELKKSAEENKRTHRHVIASLFHLQSWISERSKGKSQ